MALDKGFFYFSKTRNLRRAIKEILAKFADVLGQSKSICSTVNEYVLVRRMPYVHEIEGKISNT